MIIDCIVEVTTHYNKNMVEAHDCGVVTVRVKRTVVAVGIDCPMDTLVYVVETVETPVKVKQRGCIPNGSGGSVDDGSDGFSIGGVGTKLLDHIILCSTATVEKRRVEDKDKDQVPVPAFSFYYNKIIIL